MNNLIEQLLSGPVVQRRENGQQQDGLGALMGFLSQGGSAGQAPALPAMGRQGSGFGSAILSKFVSDKMAKHQAESDAEETAKLRAASLQEAANLRAASLQQLRDMEANPNLTSQQKMMAMAQNIDPKVAQSGLSGYVSSLTPKDQKNLQFEDIGVNGSPNLIQKVRVNSDGSYTPFGVPRTQSSGVQVNVGDKLPAPSAGFMWNKEGTLQKFIPGGPADPTVKALPENQQAQLVGVNNTRDAISNYRDILKGVKKYDYLNPDRYADMGTAYNNMMLQAKEAYNLGVLSGPDLDVLHSIVTDPMSARGVITSKGALDRQATELDRIFTKMGKVSGNAKQPQQEGKQNLYKGQPLPDGWVLGTDGRPRKQ